jgi:hypothetical protein
MLSYTQSRAALITLGLIISGRVKRPKNSIQYTTEQIKRLLNNRIKRENIETNSRLERKRKKADARIRQIKAKTAAQQQRTAEAAQRSAETAERYWIELANL